MGSVFAIILGLILMLPLLVQLQTLVILHPWKILSTLRCYVTESARDVRCGRRNLVQHYPKLPELLNTNSESMMVVYAPRTVLSSPTLPRVTSVAAFRAGVKKTIPLAQHSSSFVATQIELPVVDITCNYNSYRYKTFEEILRERYGENYPPGEVVLNYIQLNMPDSRTELENPLGNNVLLDLSGENNADVYSSVAIKMETEYLNLLDHFVSRQRGKAPTAGKFTETLSTDERSLEVSSRADTWSESTLRSSVTQDKETGSCANQRPLKGANYRQNSSGAANRRPDSSLRVLKGQ